MLNVQVGNGAVFPTLTGNINNREVHMMIDTGCQPHSIKLSIAKELNLPVISATVLSLSMDLTAPKNIRRVLLNLTWRSMVKYKKIACYLYSQYQNKDNLTWTITSSEKFCVKGIRIGR